MSARLFFLAIASSALMACGGGGTSGDDTGAHDAPAGDIDAADVTTVHSVACEGVTPDGTVTSTESMFSYDPKTLTIPVNGVVLFDNQSVTHPVGPDNSTNTDANLFAPAGKQTCLQFTAAGTFGYRCTVHGFKASITVQ